MKLNSFIKFGGLAFDVANDERVKQLAGMVHNGARRRGLIGNVTPPGNHAMQSSVAPTHWPKSETPIPFAPTSHQSSAPKAESGTSSSAPAAKSAQAGGYDLKKWVNMDNAKKAVGWLGTLNEFLNKE